ncbi:MAG TPA: saccharopine dehydrogenase NADP-binding domain-containing protein [Actinomycetes bacterium]|jgi:saccharopine dehydrogenase-like NADP-dependent oxidoreductase|nr:saccharopine dehydrogenase NADP-binding domain-containing protein [Actinomycetes bacterium]
MRVVVVGAAGAMGRWTLRDLTESEGVAEVVAADLDGARAREAAGWAAARSGSNGTARVSGMTLDAGDGQALRRAFEDADVVCNCAVRATNLPVMEACASTGTHYVDLGGLFHTTRRQLAMHDRFVAAGVTAVVGMGGSPGTTNVLAALAGRDLEVVEEVEVRLGIADFAPSSAPVPVPYAIHTLLDEFAVPAMTFREGELTEVAAMSEQEELDFPQPVGRLRVGHTLHSEVATLPLHFADRGIRSVSFKVGFPADFMDKMALLTGLGLADTQAVDLPGGRVVPRELLVDRITQTATMPGPEAAPDDAEAIWVRVRGRRAGPSGDPALAPRDPPDPPDGVLRNSPRDPPDPPDAPLVERLAECVVRPHPTWQAGAGQLDTGVPASIVAQFLGHKVIDRPGVLAPEDAVPPEPYLAELASRGMEVTLVTREPAVVWSYDRSLT